MAQQDDTMDTIPVRVTQREDLRATHADLYVRIKGASWVGGDAALKKAREVGTLVGELTRFGLPETDIHLLGVTADVMTNPLGKSSSATYTLRIRCANLEHLPDVIGIITSQKNTTLQSTVWGYAGEEALRDQLLDRGITRANSKAKRIAAGLGVQLTGIHRFNEQPGPEEHPRPTRSQDSSRMMEISRARITSEDLGMDDISNSKEVVVTIEVVYHVSGFDVPTAAG